MRDEFEQPRFAIVVDVGKFARTFGVAVNQAH
jgi:hypothetical protein